MKGIYLPDKKAPRVIYVTLLFIAGALIVLILTGTVIGLIRPRNAGPVFVIKNSVRTEPVKTDETKVYSGLERLRIPLSNSSILILSVSFPYPAKDTTFTEELATKIGDFKSITTEYFSSLPIEGADQIDEEIAKQEILKRFNANLRLGRIDALYFNDMTVIESIK
jgi:flagellar basal body-associated protein FliL